MYATTALKLCRSIHKIHKRVFDIGSSTFPCVVSCGHAACEAKGQAAGPHATAAPQRQSQPARGVVLPVSGRDGVQLVSVSIQAIVPDAVTGRTARPLRAHTNPHQ
jgi:hypothetical protein